jgi:hypothetical protein
LRWQEAIVDNSPTRTLDGNVLVSSDLPPITVEVDPGLDFIGRLRFPLYGIADADIFVFGEPGPDGIVKRSLVVQFEGYLDNNTHTYNYAMPRKVRLGEHDYMHDYYARNLRGSAERSPDSDGAHVSRLYREKGYSQPEEAIWVRLIRIIGEDRRRELLFIYLENLADLGHTAAELGDEGPLPEEHSALADSLRERALKAFKVTAG